ncbi:MAG: DUF1460 domain-containing protein [Bacteroidales bacterium]|nr:DUF1460 domain-containing protein [Bacteroidales bacterium]
MKKKFFLVIFVMTYVSTMSKAFPADTLYCTTKDKEIFNDYCNYITRWKNQPRDTIILKTAMFFLGTPYVAHTLEIEPEGLVVNLRELDCTTFVENVLTLTTTVLSGEMTFENYCSNLMHYRYRNDKINDYTDRLHYTSDWIYENQRKGLINNVTRKCGGKKLKLNLYIMSSNSDSYKQLLQNRVLKERIAVKEQEINKRKHYYIPTRKIDRRFRRIHTGDMVGFVTTIPGIDISHVGIVYKKGKTLTFIHASSKMEKVVVHEGTLSEYVKGTGRNTGIILAR